jgi:hypothetical protein
MSQPKGNDLDLIKNSKIISTSEKPLKIVRRQIIRTHALIC